ncbi:MAG: hypothetical protein ACREBG_11655 [Pyrinomonadaceae bacterium]
MTEPEISRRCSSCGASIRVRAFFCPQCGKTLSPKPQAIEANQESGEKTPEAPAQELGEETLGILSTTQLEPDNRVTIPPAVAVQKPAKVHKPGVGALHADGRARVSRRELGDDDALRGVEKWRQLSSAVLDEAAYDPSLRFVLVAAALFVLFLVMLIVSELIT